MILSTLPVTCRKFLVTRYSVEDIKFNRIAICNFDSISGPKQPRNSQICFTYLYPKMSKLLEIKQVLIRYAYPPI